MAAAKFDHITFFRVVRLIGITTQRAAIFFGILLFFQKADFSWAQQKKYSSLPSISQVVTPEASDPSETFFVQKFKVIGSTAFAQEQLDVILEPYEGRHLTFKDLLKVRAKISQLYVDHGFITSGALIPPQTLVDDTVIVSVIEGTLPTIEIEGTQRINPDYVRYRVELGVTRPFNVEKLEEQLRLLGSELLFKNIESDLKAGQTPGESTLTVRVTEVDYAEISTLIEQFKNGESVEKRLQAIELLMKIGTPASIDVALGELSSEVEAAVPQLSAGLKNVDPDIRSSAALILGKIGTAAKTTIPDLTQNLKDCDCSERTYSISAIENIAIDINKEAKTLSIFELNQVISDLEAALSILQDQQTKFLPAEITQISFPLELLKSKRNQRIFVNKTLRNPWLWSTIIYLISILGMFCLRPLWLLKAYNLLKPIGFKVPVLGADISLGFLLFPKYHPRVLDAWVTNNIKLVQENFLSRDTVYARKVFIPTSVVLDGKTIAQVGVSHLRSTLDKKRSCLLIWGEGGVGKTSLAIQTALWAMANKATERLCKHKMLPVLIELELASEVRPDKSPLVSAIQGQLQDLTNQIDPISEELLERLLREKRILVIVDHYSEWDETSRNLLRPELPDFPINALVITSRLEEKLGQVTKHVLQPLRIEGNRLSSFVEAYLTQISKRELFTDLEFFDACSRLSKIVGIQNVTILLAKLYIEQLIGVKEGSLEVSKLPNNIPELMLSYLNELNRNVVTDKLSNRTIHRDAKVIAWECLKQTYQPMAIFRETALLALGGDDAEQRLSYLEKRLQLIQNISPAQDKIRFTLDPLAEYLASLHLIDIHKDNEGEWYKFLAQIKAKPVVPNSIQGFFLALRECCSVKGKELKIADFVIETLERQFEFSSAISQR